MGMAIPVMAMTRTGNPEDQVTFLRLARIEARAPLLARVEAKVIEGTLSIVSFSFPLTYL